MDITNYALCKNKKVDYESLINKPFYEEIITNNTITWDGNTEGRILSSKGNACKVSDVVLTEEQAKGLLQVVCIDRGKEVVVDLTMEQDNWYSENNVIAFGEGWITIATTANSGPVTAGAPDTYPEPGIYFWTDSSWFKVRSLTGSISLSTEVKLQKIDSKYLPDNIATKEWVENLIGGIENGSY